MMKRILCLALCLMLALPAALAETADTLPKKFARQLTGGNGIRGKLSVTASGVADWLNVLLPFTAADIQIRAIGEKQGDMSADVADDDDWQVKLYVEDSEGQEAGTTWLYGDPQGMYFQSELLPGTHLMLPVEQVNLLYQIFKGEYSELFFAFDPMGMKENGANGNVSAYQPVADMLGIPAEEWENSWMPVLEKYLLQLDLWLTSYGDPTFQTGDPGAMTMSATYTIPADALKKEAKYIIGQMLYDTELQALLLPYVTMEQRITYLNPSMVYFYEACIDQLPLEGDIVLSREMSGLGENVSMSVELPLPALPDTLTAPVGELAAAAFELPYTDLLAGMKRVAFTQAGDERTITLTGDKRTITLTAAESMPDENTTVVSGTLKIMPNIGVDENSLSAAYSCTHSHNIWQDENYLDHDMTAFQLKAEPDLSMLSADDPFRNTYVDFAPISLDLSVDYRNNSYQESSAVQVNVNAAAKLPDAEVAMELVMRITTKIAMSTLPTAGAEDFNALTEDRKAALLDTLTANAVRTMANLNAVPEATVVPAADPVEDEEATAVAEPTTVPPANE